MGDALQTVVDRGFIPLLPDEAPAGPPAGAAPPALETDPAIVTELVAKTQASLAELRREISTKSGPALFDFILEDIQELKRLLVDPRGHQVFMSAMEASGWLNEHLEEWLGEKNVADTLTLSVPDNVTSEMGLALLHVADVIRPVPGGGGVPGAGRGRRLPRRRARRARRRARGARRDPGLARRVRHALRRRDRHHAAALERAPHHARAADPRQRQEQRAGRRRDALRARAAAGGGEGAGGPGALAGPAGRGREGRGDQAEDRPRPDLHRLSRVSEVRPGQPHLHLQAGPDGRGRAPRGRRRGARAGGRLLPHVPGAPRVARNARGGRRPAHRGSARRRTRRTRRSPRRGCSRRRARPSPARGGATTCRPAR